MGPEEPATPAPAPLQLLLTDVDGIRRVNIDGLPFTIGRRTEASLSLPADGQVSRRHAEIICERDVWYVVDAGSKSGTFLNGQRIEREVLKPGDQLRVGMTELRVTSPDTDSRTGSPGSFDFRQVNALLKGLRGLGSSAVLEEVLTLVLDSALELTGAERGFILLADEQGTLTTRLARSDDGTTLSTAQISARIPSEVFATGEDRIVRDLRDEPFAEEHAGTIALGIRHVLCTPLNAVQFGGGAAPRRIGVLYLDSREAGYLQHASALHVLAAEAAVVIENARLYREVLQKEREAQELRVAAGIQQALLPPPAYESPLVTLCASSVPCLAVGGDLFEYVGDDERGVIFTVADVAGKGTAAALLTAVMQGVLAAEADSGAPPVEVLTRVNRALCRRAVDGRFVTAFHGQLTGDGRLHYCNAGHNPPLLLNASGVERLAATGCPLGLFEQAPYEPGVAPIAAGDLLVLYSDGVTEAVNEAGEEFGEERLAARLRELREQPVGGVLRGVQDTLRDFIGTAPVGDDITLMVIRPK